MGKRTNRLRHKVRYLLEEAACLRLCLNQVRQQIDRYRKNERFMAQEIGHLGIMVAERDKEVHRLTEERDRLRLLRGSIEAGFEGDLEARFTVTRASFMWASRTDFRRILIYEATRMVDELLVKGETLRPPLSTEASLMFDHAFLPNHFA